MTMTTATLIL